MANNERNRMDIQAERKAQKTERRAAEKKATKKTSVKNTIIVVCVILMFALAIALFAYKQIVTSGIIERNTTVMSTDNFKVTSSMMTYYYNSNYQNFAGQYGSYLSSFGLDTSKDLREQKSMDGTTTWYDYFLNQAKEQAENYLILCEGAKANGIELDSEDAAEIKEVIDGYKEAASKYGYDANTYVKLIFGTSVNLKDMKKCMELSQLASKYSEFVADSYEYTDEDYRTYFDENSDKYNYVDYYRYTFAAVADDDGNYSGEEKAEMKAKSEELASCSTIDEFKAYVKDYLVGVETAKLKEDDELDEAAIDTKVEELITTHVSKANAGNVADWAFDASTAVGDTYVVSDDEKGSYTVYMLDKTSYIDDYTTKNGAYIYVSDSSNTDAAGSSKKADEIMAEWEASDKTAETFFAMTEKYSEAGHLHEMVENIKNTVSFKDTLYADGKQVGDVEKYVSESDKGVYIVYYAGDGMIAWKADVDTALRNEQYSKDYEEMEKTYAVSANDSKLQGIIPVSLGSSN